MVDDPNRLVKRLVQARAGGRVERLHIIPHRQGYTNAAHSWGVAMLMLHLWPEDFPRLAEVCLTHDIPEGWTGDIPSPVFRYAPEAKEYFGRLHDRINAHLGHAQEGALSPDDLAKLKACDLIEFYMFCKEEVSLGNKLMIEHCAAMEHNVDHGKIVFPKAANILFWKLAKSDLIPSWHDFLEEHASGLGAPES